MVPSISWLQHHRQRSTVARKWVGRADLGHPSCGPSLSQISSKQGLNTGLYLIGQQKLNSETSPHEATTLPYELNSGNTLAPAKQECGNTNISPKRVFNMLKCRTYYSEVSSCR